MVITGHNPWRFLWILTLIWDITAHDSVKNDLVNYGTEKGAQTMVLERMRGVPLEGILAQLACLGSGVHCVCVAVFLRHVTNISVCPLKISNILSEKP